MATKKRKEPGSTGNGKFYRIQVQPKEKFVKHRTQDVGRKGGLERLAGKKKDGEWETETWLVSKEVAHITNDKLVIENKKVKESLKKSVKGPVKHVKADIFKAKPVTPKKKKSK